MTWRWRALRLAALVCAIVLTGGCASSADEPPVPTISGSKDARGHDPCMLLTAEQAGGFGLAGPGQASRAQEGPRCAWRGPGGATLTLTLYTDGGGLGTLAANSEPTTTRVRIAGYPALETFTGHGEFCQYDVGVAANQVVTAAAQAMAPDSCTALQAQLPTILGNLPAAGG